MELRSLRRLTNDRNHNAFTGAQWFQGSLYVAFRQGLTHVDESGRIVVLRSRDGGSHFETAAVLRGELDTRDAHLHAEGDKRLFVNGFEHTPITPQPGRAGYDLFAGTAWTDNGLDWSPWTRVKGAENYVLWRPEYFKDRHYCAGYTVTRDGRGFLDWSRVSWFESTDAVDWKLKRVLREGEDQPNECSLAFQSDGAAVILARREHPSRHPLLLRAKPPYEVWESTPLEVPLSAPAVWLVDEEIWMSGRWFASPRAAHQGVFRLVGDTPVLEMVLPSGPAWDCTYMGVAQHPLNRHRFNLSYYSGHTATDDPAVLQFETPDIYLADVVFAAEFIADWNVLPLQSELPLAGAVDPGEAEPLSWTAVSSIPDGAGLVSTGFVDVSDKIAGRAGVIYLTSRMEVGPCDHGFLHLGYDGPLRVWLNGEHIFEGVGTNPAQADQTSIAVKFQHGTNRLTIALDTNGGRACGIFARYDKA